MGPMPRGRPPQDGEPRRAMLQVKCHEHQRDAWRAAAEVSGMELSEWVRERLDAAAEKETR